MVPKYAPEVTKPYIESAMAKSCPNGKRKYFLNPRYANVFLAFRQIFIENPSNTPRTQEIRTVRR